MLELSSLFLVECHNVRLGTLFVLMGLDGGYALCFAARCLTATSPGLRLVACRGVLEVSQSTLFSHEKVLTELVGSEREGG